MDGFKSLRNFAIDLAPFTALVGPNSAGKSNILEALELLSHLASEPIEAAFKHGRGRAIDKFTREGGEPVRTIRFAVELLLPVDVLAKGGETTNRLRYELIIARERRESGADTLLVEHEKLTTIAASQDRWTKQYPARAEHIHHAEGQREVFCQVQPLQRDIEKGVRRVENQSHSLIIPNTHTALAAARNRTFGAEIRVPPEVWSEIQELAKLAQVSVEDLFSKALDTISPEMALKEAVGGERLPPRGINVVATMLSTLRLVRPDATHLHGESERIGGASLAPDASNLPTVLAALSPRLLGEIRADFVALVPGISTFDVVAEKDSFHIEIELSGGDRLPARLVSDGTLRALALLTALRSKPSPSVIAIEEPENGIYPGRLRTLLNLLREASEPRGTSAETGGEEEGEEPQAAPPQVIITSHSPVVLAAMRDDLAGLRFIDTVRREGHLRTRARRVGPAAPGERGQNSLPLHEVDALLSLATSEAAE